MRSNLPSTSHSTVTDSRSTVSTPIWLGAPPYAIGATWYHVRRSRRDLRGNKHTVLHRHLPSQLADDTLDAVDARQRLGAVLGAVGERRRGLDVGLEARCEV